MWPMPVEAVTCGSHVRVISTDALRSLTVGEVFQTTGGFGSLSGVIFSTLKSCLRTSYVLEGSGK